MNVNDHVSSCMNRVLTFCRFGRQSGARARGQ